MTETIEVTVDGFQLIVFIDARTKMALAPQGVPVHKPEVRSIRALVTQVRTDLRTTPACRRSSSKGVGWVHVWWLDRHELRFGIPAKANTAVTTDILTQAGEGVTMRIYHRPYKHVLLELSAYLTPPIT